MAAQAQGATPEPELDLTALTSALDSLTKAATATTLSKGEIANSGTYSDGKPAGGGQGSMSDAGSIDDLMIAKMSAAGVDAGTIAAFRAFMSDEKKKKDGEANGGSGTPPMPPFQRSAPAATNLAKSIQDDPEVQEGVDVSPFLEALTARTVEAITSLEKSLSAAGAESRDFAKSQGQMNVATARALVQIGNLAKSQSAVIEELNKRLGLVERQPVAQPRGRTNAVALNKSMPGEAGQGQLRKSEVVSALSYMNLEKGVKQINGVSTSHLIGLYEGGGVLDESTLHAVHQFLAENPKEANLARTYG